MIADKTKQAAGAMRSALCRMANKYPYHAEWLSFERWNEEPAVETMAVTARDGRVRFHYSPVFVCECMADEIQAVVHHELNHLVFRHPYADPRNYPNRHARVIAEEVTVNEHVPEPLPGKPLLLAEFPDLPPGEDTDTRYHRLAHRTDLADKVRLMDPHALWRENPLEENAWSSDMISIHRAITGEVAGDGRDQADALNWALHHSWGMRAGPAIVETLRAAGVRPRPLDWKRILAERLGLAQRQPVFHRPPRRMPDLVGVFPGASCRTDKPRVLAAIDTSSSMKKPHFQRVRAELDRIRDLADVTIVQCDKTIHKTHPLKGPLQNITGRGGTDLRPPFDRAVLDKIRPSVIIYFTDGDGPTPKHAPSIPVVWCLTRPGKRPADWGQIVHMKT